MRIDYETCRPESTTPNEKIIFKLLEGKQVKANHAITCLNPDEWFTPIAVWIKDNNVYVIGENTCWFNLSQCEVRNKQ